MVEQLPRTGKAGVCRLSNYHGRPEAYFARWTSFSGRPLAADVLAVISSHVVTVVLLSQLKQKPDDYINLRVATRRMDCLQGNSTTAATDLELVPSPNLPKNEDSRQPQCPEDKESAIVEALKHFKMNS